MTTTTHILPHPYRVNEPTTGCVVCQTEAFALCPRCRRPFCSDHASVSGSCADCEIALSRRTYRGKLVVVSLYIVALTTLLFYIGITNGFILVCAGVCGVLGGMMASAIGGRIARGRDRSWIPVENASLQLAADGGDPAPARRLGHLIGGRGREKDMYTAAYKAGFNRVQGCA